MKTKTLPKKAAKTFASFREAHDKNFIVPQKIRQGLTALGKDGWEYETDFIRACGLRITDFQAFSGEFEDFIVNLPASNSSRARRVWAGSKALAAKMREML